MTTLIHADIFFLISTIGFIVLFAFSVVLLIYVVGIVRQVKKVSEKIAGNVENISEEASEFIRDVRESSVYRMLFARKRKK